MQNYQHIADCVGCIHTYHICVMSMSLRGRERWEERRSLYCANLLATQFDAIPFNSISFVMVHLARFPLIRRVRCHWCSYRWCCFSLFFYCSFGLFASFSVPAYFPVHLFVCLFVRTFSTWSKCEKCQLWHNKRQWRENVIFALYFSLPSIQHVSRTTSIFEQNYQHLIVRRDYKWIQN